MLEMTSFLKFKTGHIYSVVFFSWPGRCLSNQYFYRSYSMMLFIDKHKHCLTNSTAEYIQRLNSDTSSTSVNCNVRFEVL